MCYTSLTVTISGGVSDGLSGAGSRTQSRRQSQASVRPLQGTSPVITFAEGHSSARTSCEVGVGAEQHCLKHDEPILYYYISGGGISPSVLVIATVSLHLAREQKGCLSSCSGVFERRAGCLDWTKIEIHPKES